jgi:predicted CoA-binding protein
MDKIEQLELEILRRAHTLAVVGLSSIPVRAGYYVPAYMQRAGYRIVPVNPELSEALGSPAFPDLHAIPFPVECVLIFRRPEHIPGIVEQAIDIRAKYIWMQLGLRHEGAASRACAAGLGVVMDACIMVEHRRLSDRLEHD